MIPRVFSQVSQHDTACVALWPPRTRSRRCLTCRLGERSDKAQSLFQQGRQLFMESVWEQQPCNGMHQQQAAGGRRVMLAADSGPVAWQCRPASWGETSPTDPVMKQKGVCWCLAWLPGWACSPAASVHLGATLPPALG